MSQTTAVHPALTRKKLEKRNETVLQTMLSASMSSDEHRYSLRLKLNIFSAAAEEQLKIKQPTNKIYRLLNLLSADVDQQTHQTAETVPANAGRYRRGPPQSSGQYTGRRRTKRLFFSLPF